MAPDGTRQQLACACGHTGVLYTSPDFAPMHPGLRVGGFVNRNSAGLDLDRLFCGVCQRQGHVTRAPALADRRERFTVSTGLTVAKAGRDG